MNNEEVPRFHPSSASYGPEYGRVRDGAVTYRNRRFSHSAIRFREGLPVLVRPTGCPDTVELYSWGEFVCTARTARRAMPAAVRRRQR